MADSPYIQNITTETFETQVIQASLQTPVLVDFWAPWCGPCRSLTPILEKLAAEYDGAFILAKVNTDDEKMLAGQIGIRSLPTVVLIKEGQLLDQFMGALPEGEVRKFLEQHIEKPEASAQDQIESLLASGRIEQAIASLRLACQDEPDNHELKVTLAGALLQAGVADETKQILENLPAEARDSGEAKAILARIQFADLVKDAPDLNTLQQAVDTDPADLGSRYLLGARRLVAGEYEAALDQFMEMMKRDRQFEDDLGRRSLVDAFAVIDDRALVGRFRQEMTKLLF